MFDRSSHSASPLVADTEGGTPHDPTAEPTSAFRPDFVDEPDAAATKPQAQAWEMDEFDVDSAIIVVKRGPNAGSRFILNQPVTSAGRHARSDIFLDDVTVSRTHAEFRREQGEFRLVDLDSLNGTFVNHKPVKSVMLVNGDQIQIGKFNLIFLAPHR
ncbi:pSer/pThr/pTyr-binding forkhead associated (FHA) protein [Mycobacterium frederiksbergense]|uniref:PSer/pThr/pTyr-binding forkhead associated (FHA) protein n=1 Tax=Mycolicibacterium frederiksbergense TaxID=117567 RepID=A0ABT6KVI0_9MYCO|nr:FHA domain-containing protein [Mycolicibacterium frederiksbergense]MDH6193990.1 pSer/pThr/pTyr-binding forkhead associated (FHA) protein [Mycolicibacterium frederiksbergense]